MPGIPGGVLFDLDGCLVDSRLPFSTSVNAALEAHGFARRPDEELWPYLGPPLQTTFAELTGADEATARACLLEYRRIYGERMVATTPVFDGIVELLEALAPRPRAVCTSKAIHLARPLVEGLGLLPHFVDVVGSDPSLPHEDKAVTVARALEVLPDAEVLVGDTVFDVNAARANGLRCIGVLWGIGTAEELTAAGADALAEHPRDVLAHL